MLTIYSKQNCPQCVAAKNKLAAANISFTEIRVDLDTAARNMLVEAGHRSVPVIYKDGVCVELEVVLNKEI